MKSNKLTERVLDILEWDAVQNEISYRCWTPIGKKIATSIEPLAIEEIRKQQRLITELKEIIDQGNPPDFSGIIDIKSLLDVAGKGGILSIEELLAIREFTIASNRIRNYINKNREKLKIISLEFSRIDRLEFLRDLLISSITDSKELNADVYPELKRIKGEILSVEQEIEKKLTHMIYSPQMGKILQEKIFTVRNDRYVILVKSNLKGSVRGTVHDLSNSGATIFIEPEATISLNNKLVMLKRDLQIEVNRVLKSLSKEISKFVYKILDNMDLLAYFDLLSAAAKFSLSIKGNEVEISEDFIIDLHDARHPLLYLMNPDAVIPNDISIGKDFNCLIISGANTGGKTVLLKTIGLCELLTIHGFHIPANKDSKIGVFSNILADIGDDQSIIQSLSTYSGQMMVINEVIERADKKSLILIDEIVVGTNPREGAALAQAILETLIETEAKILVTTHYPELKQLAPVDKRFHNSSVSFDIETLKPTFKLRTGTPGASYAFEIARIYGLSEKILSRSRELLDNREITAEALIENIQKHKEEIEEEKLMLNELKEKLRVEKNRYLDLQKEQEVKIEEIKNERGIEFLEELDRYRDEIAYKVKEMQRGDIKGLGKLQQDIIGVENRISTQMRRDSVKRFRDRYIAFDPNKTEKGDRVFIAPLEKEGRIEAIDKSKGDVLLILGNSIKTRYKFEDLLVPILGRREIYRSRAYRKVKEEYKEYKSSNIPHTIQTRYNTIDLRGSNVDEAIIKLEQNFDRMIRDGVTSAVVIHGHGTGALKVAVRERLKNSNYVRNYRPGEYGEGGDGVSIVLLMD